MNTQYTIGVEEICRGGGGGGGGGGGVTRWFHVICGFVFSQWTLTIRPRMFAQLFVQVQIKENIKAPRHWP